MRKIETIKKEIERAEAAIRKAEEALGHLKEMVNNRRVAARPPFSDRGV